MLSAAIASIIVGIPIAHIHGGEITEGAIDDSMRHCITKLSSIHLAASDEYKKRIIQMGENPKNVYNVGGLGVDNIKKTKLLNKEKLETLLGCKFYKKNLLITFHPETIDRKLSLKHMRQLLKALENFNSTRLIFTMPNADMGSKAIFNLIKIFARNNPNVFVCKSMGRLAYLSCISHVDAVVGNSSSGILEVPALKKPTINIGNRQKGRAQPLSVISVKPIVKSIISAISMSYEKKYQTKQYYKNNPYGNGGAIKKIVNILEKIDYRNLSKKTFYDLPGWIN
jgi:GDP/UDP-N,N'-diacetylbacillosamine 2-epimerase (hydrolysing)